MMLPVGNKKQPLSGICDALRARPLGSVGRGRSYRDRQRRRVSLADTAGDRRELLLVT